MRSFALLVGFVCAPALLALGCAGDEERRLIGDTCARDGECASARCDEMTCKSGNPAAEGEPCDHPLECLSEVCTVVEGTTACGRGIRTPDAPCSADAQCASQECVVGKCAGEAIPDAGGSDLMSPDSTSPDAGSLDQGPPDGLSPDLASADTTLPDQQVSDVLVVPSHKRSQVFGDASRELSTAVTIDAAGNVTITGHFAGEVDFGGGPLVSAGDSDIFVASFEESGQHRWSMRFGAASTDEGLDIKADAGGELVVVGSFTDQVAFDGGSPLASAGGSDIFLARFDSAGQHLRSARYGGLLDDRARSVYIDDAGAVAITGSFHISLDFGGGTLSSAGGSDIFAARFDRAGLHEWSARFGGTGNDQGSDIAIGPSGEMVLTGNFENTLDFGGGPMTSAGQTDVFLVRFDVQGVYHWAKRFGDAYLDLGDQYVAVDANGNVALLSEIWGSIDYGGGLLTSRGQWDVVLAHYDRDGGYNWSRRFGDTAAATGEDIAVDKYGNIVITGYYLTNINFGGGPLGNAGAYDVYVAQLDPRAQHQWSMRFGSTGEERANGLALGPNGQIAITGSFTNAADFGDGVVQSAGDRDIFLLELAP